MIDAGITQGVLDEVREERAAQDRKWGVQNYPDGTGGPIFRGAALDAKRRTDQAAADGRLTYRHILGEEFYEAMAESDPEKLRAELLQVAAVAVAWVERIDRDV